MLRLQTFGGLSLTRDGRAMIEASTRLHGLAVLARLAAAGDRGLSRDKLLGCFWPERDERHARHALSQTLYDLRRAVGDGDFVRGGEILHLDPAAISSDVAEMNAAVTAGDHAAVEALYAGPFLDGIWLAGADEFERWAEDERGRHASRYVRSLRALVTAARRAGDTASATAHLEHLAALEPLDASVDRELVGSLLRAGEHGAALRHGRARHDNGRPAAPASDSPLTQRTVVELCARGRQCLHMYTPESYAEGMRVLRRAVELAPMDGTVHAALGALHVILSQADPGADARARGVAHCETAARLDPGLSEAYLWHAWAMMRDGRHAEAEALASRAVAADPRLHFTHFVRGCIRMVHGLATGDRRRLVEAVADLQRALDIHPGEQHALMPLGCLYALDGQYDAAADVFGRALAVERWASRETSIIGALTLTGLLHLRRGEVSAAREWLGAAQAEYGGRREFFVPFLEGLTLCGLGDVERFAGANDAALVLYERGRRIVDALPQLVGTGFLLARLELRRASAYRRLRMRREEKEAGELARTLTRTRGPHSFGWCWEVSEAQLHYDWAVYHATCGERDEVAASLTRAVTFGWREPSLLDTEPAFQGCRTGPELDAVRAAVSARQALPQSRATTTSVGGV